MHVPSPMFTGARWQTPQKRPLSPQSSQPVSFTSPDTFEVRNPQKQPRFQGAHQLLVDNNGNDVGGANAWADAWGGLKDGNLNGVWETRPLKNGTSYYLTKWHKALYLLLAWQHLNEKNKPITPENLATAHVKDAQIEYITSISDDEARWLYQDSDLYRQNQQR